MDKKYMQIAIDLAHRGFPMAMPNPMVGCVIVHNQTIIGKGYHKNYGQAHAEVNAIDSVVDKSLLQDSTLFVTLEPCAHYGKTPPCADLIVEHKIPRVVIGSLDTFSQVNGQGIARLESAGVNVKTSILEKECRAINPRFFTFHEKKRPYVILKWAKSADGFMAPANQDKPFWLSGQDAKELVHQWRTEESAILVGKNTVLKDNPLLTAREVKGKNPIRIVLDKTCSLPSTMAIFNSDAPTLVVNQNHSSEQRIQVDFKRLIPSLMEQLHKLNIQSLIVEGGAQTLQSFITANLWDEARVFTSNKKLHDGLQSPVIKKDIKKEISLTNDSLSFYFNS